MEQDSIGQMLLVGYVDVQWSRKMCCVVLLSAREHYSLPILHSYGVSVSCVDKGTQLPCFQASQWSIPYTQLTSFKYAIEIKLTRAVLELYTVSMWPKMLNMLVYSKHTDYKQACCRSRRFIMYPATMLRIIPTNVTSATLNQNSSPWSCLHINTKQMHRPCDAD
jgi:hypothetical protein